MSSYNDFLSQIEVDEKELKRDLQNRKKKVNLGLNPKVALNRMHLKVYKNYLVVNNL